MLLQEPRLPRLPQRIISLVPSQTELLVHLELHDRVCGITRYCVHPAHWLREKTCVGGTKNPDLSLIRSLQPDLIIANQEENTREAVEQLAETCPVWVTRVGNLQEALQMISDLGQLTGTGSKASELTAAIRTAFSELNPVQPPLPAAYLIWRKPYMTAGGDTFIHAMLDRCGLQNVFGAAARYPVTDAAELASRGCRVLLLSSEPYPFKEKHVQELQTQLPETIIRLVDGEYFSWYGSRLREAPRYFSSLLQELARQQIT